MTVETFGLKTDPNTGREYIYKKLDEMNKNNREGDKKPSSGIMPAKNGDAMCPVATYKLYVSKLNDGCKRLWQRPRNSFLDGDTTWYCAVPLGEKTLSSFMSKISASLQLPIKYTNHSIRATGATLLSRENFNNAQIMAVTGHKSVSSLAVYQRVSNDEKMKMGDVLSTYLDPASKSLIKIPSPAVNTNNNSGSSSTIPHQHIINKPLYLSNAGAENEIDFSLAPMTLEEFDSFLDNNNNSSLRVREQHNNGQHTRHHEHLPLFANCNISSLTINYNR